MEVLCTSRPQQRSISRSIAHPPGQCRRGPEELRFARACSACSWQQCGVPTAPTSGCASDFDVPNRCDVSGPPTCPECYTLFIPTGCAPGAHGRLRGRSPRSKRTIQRSGVRFPIRWPFLDGGVFHFRAPALPAQRVLGGGFGRGAKPPSECFGGSALLMTMFSAGVLLNVSQHGGSA